MAKRNGKEGKVKPKERTKGISVRGLARTREGRTCAGVGVMEEELQERDGRETFVGLLVVGRRTLQIPVNRIQLRCYREYR